jgi:hypothetical protein
MYQMYLIASPCAISLIRIPLPKGIPRSHGSYRGFLSNRPSLFPSNPKAKQIKIAKDTFEKVAILGDNLKDPKF